MKTILPSRVEGTITAPPSKSVMIRAVAASMLVSGVSEILNPSFCDDAIASLGIAEAFGADITINANRITVHGFGAPGNKKIRRNIMNCRESGLCMRMFTPIAGLAKEEIVLGGVGSLMKRPMNMDTVMRTLRAQCETDNGFAPIRIQGKMSGGRFAYNGTEGSQFLTGLLMALPLCSLDSDIEVLNLKSKPYIDITVELLKKYGVFILHDNAMNHFFVKGNQPYKPCMYSVEGDWSGAAFMLVAGAIGGSISVKGLHGLSCQADRAILDALEAAGAKIDVGEDAVSVHQRNLNAFEFDATECPDLFPPLVALAAHCDGKSSIYGAQRLIHKESNRALALVTEFAKLGVEMELYNDRIDVNGAQVGRALINSHNDHRIAMACAVAGLNGTGDVVIDRPTCVFKSYPNFFEDLELVRKKHG